MERPQSKYAAKHERQVMEEYEIVPSHKDKWIAKELVKRVAVSYRQLKEWKDAGIDRFKLDSETYFEFSDDSMAIYVYRVRDYGGRAAIKVVPRFSMQYATPEEALGVAYVLAAQPWVVI